MCQCRTGKPIICIACPVACSITLVYKQGDRELPTTKVFLNYSVAELQQHDNKEITRTRHLFSKDTKGVILLPIVKNEPETDLNDTKSS